MNWKCRDCCKLVPFDWLICPFCNETHRHGPVYLDEIETGERAEDYLPGLS